MVVAVVNAKARPSSCCLCFVASLAATAATQLSFPLSPHLLLHHRHAKIVLPSKHFSHAKNTSLLQYGRVLLLLLLCVGNHLSCTRMNMK